LDTLRKNVLDDLRKSGFPLEIQVGSRFSNKGWSVRHQAISRGEGELKPRYIDIVATKLIEGNFGRFNRLNFTIVCECKKSEAMPWVFYSPPEHLIKEVAAVTFLKTLSEPPLELTDLSLLAKSHFLNREPMDRFAQTSHLAFWKENQNPTRKQNRTEYNQINGAISQVLNATDHQIRMLKQIIKLVPGILMVICPLIVLDGSMFEYDLATDGEPNLRPTTYVKYLAASIHPETKLVLPNNQSVMTSYTEDYLIDIVTTSSLTEYIGWLEEDMRLITS